jgi:hypothetical protein
MGDSFGFADLADNVIGDMSCRASPRHSAAVGRCKIVAKGSSSTSGRGDVVPHPYRLEICLRAHYDMDEYPDL